MFLNANINSYKTLYVRVTANQKSETFVSAYNWNNNSGVRKTSGISDINAQSLVEYNIVSMSVTAELRKIASKTQLYIGRIALSVKQKIFRTIALVTWIQIIIGIIE